MSSVYYMNVGKARKKAKKASQVDGEKLENVVLAAPEEDEGEQNFTPRIYMQGQMLATQGWSKGDQYEMAISEDKKVIRLDRVKEGKRVVSAKNKGETPVIDLQNLDLNKVVAGIDRVRIVVREDHIMISVHHLDAKQQERVTRLKTKLAKGEKLNLGSLAHGGGILDAAIHKGLEAAGVKSRLAFAVELEEKYLETSMRNNPVWDKDSIAICAPMEEVEYHLLDRVEGIIAGIPCTGASLSGRAKNGLKLGAEEHETAGALFVAYLTAISVLQPAFLVLENVPPYQNTLSMVVIRNVLESLGYELQERVIDGMGALENRNRFVMVAVTKGLDLDFDLDAVLPIREKEPNLAVVLEDIPADSPRWKTFDYLAEKEVRDIEAGKGFRRQLLDGSEEFCGTIGKGYAKCRSTEPFIIHPQHSAYSRLLTPVEHARVKTIDESLIEGLSDTVAHELMGQAVIPAAFEAVGQSLGASLCALDSSEVRMAA